MGFLSRLGRGPSESTEQSVARNLTHVFNAKKGYAEAAEVFGLGDYDDQVAAKALLAELMQEMADQAAAHEPRAARPEVTFTGHEGSLYAIFRLRCEIEGRVVAFRIRMHTILRYVEVRPIPPDAPQEGAT